MSQQNLDQLCAQCGYLITTEIYKALRKASDTENHITKSLGVLQEDGVYAFFLYQASRKEKGGDELTKQAHALFRAAGIKPFDTVKDALLAVRGDKQQKGLADNLDELLLAKQLLEQALIYARYHAKALDGESNKS